MKNIWKKMRNRCNNPNNQDYKYYGGAGIAVCPEWDSFAQFVADMGPRPSPSHTIDRIDPNGGYSKANCRWATRMEQNQNRRYMRRLVLNGESKPLYTVAREVGIDPETIWKRVKRGVPHDEAIKPCAANLQRPKKSAAKYRWKLLNINPFGVPTTLPALGTSAESGAQ